MKEIIESLHLPVGSEYVKHFLIKQGYTYKKKSLYAKEQDCPRCAGKTQHMDRKIYLVQKRNIKYILNF